MLPKATTARLVPQTQQLAGRRVPVQTVQIRQGAVAARQRGDQRPRPLGVRSPSRTLLQRAQTGQLAKQIHVPSHARKKANSGHARDAVVAEIDDKLAGICYHVRTPPVRT